MPTVALSCFLKLYSSHKCSWRILLHCFTLIYLSFIHSFIFFQCLYILHVPTYIKPKAFLWMKVLASYFCCCSSLLGTLGWLFRIIIETNFPLLYHMVVVPPLCSARNVWRISEFHLPKQSETGCMNDKRIYRFMASDY